MTGPEHYRAAEEHLLSAADCHTAVQDDRAAWHQRQARAHAVLALAAATALPSGLFEDWRSVAETRGGAS